MPFADDENVAPIELGSMVETWPAPLPRLTPVLPVRPNLLSLECPRLPSPMPLYGDDATVTRCFVNLVRSYADVIDIPRPRMPAKRPRDTVMEGQCRATLSFLGDHHISPPLWLSWQPRVGFPKLIDLPRAKIVYGICRSAWRYPSGSTS